MTAWEHLVLTVTADPNGGKSQATGFQNGKKVIDWKLKGDSDLSRLLGELGKREWAMIGLTTSSASYPGPVTFFFRKSKG
jgi:hypothetical protein